ncbi:MAG: hypothetical protein FWF22_01250 [Treponema sp.]|nr:hypothetical protein [Treponema sp.]
MNTKAAVFVCCLCLNILLASLPVYGQAVGNDPAGSIIKALDAKKITYEVRPLLQNYGGFGYSVLVRLPGKDNNAGTFVLAVPVDSEFACSTALAFIDKAVSKQGADINADLIVAFLGNEKSVLDRQDLSHTGLKDLISIPDMPETWTVCYLEGDAPPQSIQIRHGSGKYIAPLELVKPLPPLFKSYGIPYSFEAMYNELYKLNLIRGSDELALLNAGEIYGICLYPGAPDASGAQISGANLAALLLDYAGSLPYPVLNPDHHYTILSMSSGNVYYISETITLILFIACSVIFFAGILVYSAFHRIKLISRLRLFIRRGWIFMVFLPLMILIVRGVGFFCGFLYGILGVPVPYIDFWGWVLNVFLAISLFNLLSHWLDYLHFPRKAQLYGIYAILITGVGVLVSAALDLTYASIFMWAFVFCFIGGSVKKQGVIICSVLLIPLRTLGAIYNIYEAGGLPAHLFVIQGNFGEFMALENWVAAFQIAVLCLPIMLLVKRILIINNTAAYSSYRNRSTKKNRLSFVIWLCVLVMLVVIIALNALFFTHGTVQIRRTIEQNYMTDNFSVSLTQTNFQESRIVNIRLQSQGNPVLFDLVLESDDNETPLIYSAPVPVERQADNSVKFILGENPPNPLNLEIVLGNDFTGGLRADAWFNKWDAGLDPGLPEDSVKLLNQVQSGKQEKSADYLLDIQSGLIPLTR